MAAIVGSVLADQDFGLAGGAALISQGLVNRLTNDLDFFGASGDVIREQLPSILEALTDEGFEVEIQRESPTFVRISVFGLGSETEVDLAVDARLFPLQPGAISLVLSAKELAVDKVLAIFGRAEPRDFIDLAALVEHFDLLRLFELAVQKDPGFSPEAFAAMAKRIDVLPRREFDIDDVSYEALRTLVVQWRDLSLGRTNAKEAERGIERGNGLER